MTYVHKKLRMFHDRGDFLKPERRRSESRLKTYPSSADVRNWCDEVEDRRQHMIELITKDISKCMGKLIPVEVIIDTLMASKNAEIAQLKGCLKQLWSFVYGLDLTGDEAKRLKELTGKMDKVCADLGPEKQKLAAGDECDSECAASARHEREKEEIEALTKTSSEDAKPPTIKTKFRGAGKMVTRIKGLPPGFVVVPDEDPSRPGHITIRAGTARPKRSPTSEEEPSPGADGVRSASPAGPGSGKDEPEDERRSAGCEEDVVNKKSAYTVTSQPVDYGNVQDKLAATEALCKEQQATIRELTKDRDDLKKKLAECLRELENFKRVAAVANPTLPASCQEEIEALEAEIKIMRSGNPSPEEEAEIIRKEVDVLRRYCAKLKAIEDENQQLKVELSGKVVAVEGGESGAGASRLEASLRDRLENLEGLTRERDALANRVHLLEKQLSQYQDLPDDVDLIRSRSDMLDGVLEERDGLSRKVKQMRELEVELAKFKRKAERVDDLERELKAFGKSDRDSGTQLKKTQSMCDSLEKELRNARAEREAMSKRIENMKKELEGQRAKLKEAEMLRLERDRLQIRLNELADIQAQYEEMTVKMKTFDNVQAERDMYRRKYEDVLDMECKCEMLRAQVEEARAVGRERDQLQKQVQDLEACICEQEDEIKNLVVQADNVARIKTESNSRMNTIFESMKDEMAKKDKMVAASEEKLAQSEGLRARNKELEKLLHNAEHAALQKDCHIRCLEDELRARERSLKTGRTLTRKDLDSVEGMRRELEAAKAENKKLQDIASKMSSLSGDEHVKKLLKQSECAVKRVVQELGKQYKDWDRAKAKHPRGKFACLCHSAGGEVSSGDDCDKLRGELEELQREKVKLETTVKQMQKGAPSPGGGGGGACCQKEVCELRQAKAGLEDRLRKEIGLRQSLERKINV